MYANKGDQAIQKASELLYARYLPSANLTFTSPLPDAKSPLQSILNTLHHDTILLSVGHPVQDRTSWLYIPSVFWRLCLGVIFGKSVGMMAGGVSYVRSRLLRRWVTWMLNRSIIVSVRDRESAERLQRWGVAKPIIIAADPAFLLCPVQTERADAFLHSLADRPVVGIAPRRWFHYEHSFFPVRRVVSNKQLPEQAVRYRQALIDCVNYVVDQLGGSVVLIAMKPGDDTRPGQDDDVFARELLAQVDHPEDVLAMPKEFTVNEIKHCLKSFALLVGVRMHSTILALSVKTPCISLYYSEKGHSLFKAFKLTEYALPIEDCTSEALVSLVQDAWLNQDGIKARIAAELPAIESRVGLPYEYLAQNWT
jgi:polysaccharide pyruvyl transferase WcaK-like protein